MVVEVTRDAFARLLADAGVAHPYEACGILLGEGGRVEQIRSAANVHPDPASCFEIDPQALIDAHREARSGGPQVVGYYHSHPGGTAEPSATDRTKRSGDGRIWAIVAGEEVAFWCDEPGGFVPLSYTPAGR